jgi:hypothetical protein
VCHFEKSFYFKWLSILGSQLQSAGPDRLGIPCREEVAEVVPRGGDFWYRLISRGRLFSPVVNDIDLMLMYWKRRSRKAFKLAKSETNE